MENIPDAMSGNDRLRMQTRADKHIVETVKNWVRGGEELKLINYTMWPKVDFKGRQQTHGFLNRLENKHTTQAGV